MRGRPVCHHRRRAPQDTPATADRLSPGWCGCSGSVRRLEHFPILNLLGCASCWRVFRRHIGVCLPEMQVVLHTQSASHPLRYSRHATPVAIPSLLLICVVSLHSHQTRLAGQGGCTKRQRRPTSTHCVLSSQSCVLGCSGILAHLARERRCRWLCKG